MSDDPAETTRRRRREELTDAELRVREQARTGRFGRWGRLRSWATALVGLAVIAACILMIRHTA